MNDYRYLIKGRLQDIIAAIQVLGIHDWRACGAKNWEKKLGDPLSATNKVDGWTSDVQLPDLVAAWSTVFKEHPEFFYLKPGSVALRLRYGLAETYDPDSRRDLSFEQIGARAQGAGGLEPRPLKSEEIQALIKSAIELHARDVAHSQESRWKILLTVPLVGSLIGSILGAFIAAILKRT